MASQCTDTRRRCGNGTVEPHPQVVGLDRIGRRVHRRIREGSRGELVRCWTHTRGHDERLSTKATDKVPDPYPGAIGQDIALIPAETKGFIGKLAHEKVKVCVWW